ncbi:uncharacterized protein LOC126249457 [Schistocerca nitens]|uniref:uncharacterized protein LOC126249457 n=1 Tax=Schistocerca nitens TaxID=7011 RepID=UPI0021181D01|nr:uncharacterized protein LOC126249457 [Schistocerca nitens]
MTAQEATALANQIKNYTFLISLVIWYDVLLHISVVNKTLQTIDVNVSEAVEMLEKTKAYFETCRTEEKFVSFLTDSKELATELKLEDLTLPRVRVSQRRNIVTTPLDERFNQLKSHCDYFDFLYDIGKLKNAPPDSLVTKCRNFAAILQDRESSDIDALELREELKVLSTLLKPGIGSKETLMVIGRHNFCPNVNIALRILLTLPATVASLLKLARFLRSGLTPFLSWCPGTALNKSVENVTNQSQFLFLFSRSTKISGTVCLILNVLSYVYIYTIMLNVIVKMMV